jgi:hypothetical protein
LFHCYQLHVNLYTPKSTITIIDIGGGRHRKPKGCFLNRYRSNPNSTVGNCLTDEALIYDSQEFNQNIGTHPGQLTNPNDQCKSFLGPSSYYGWVSSSIEQYTTHAVKVSNFKKLKFRDFFFLFSFFTMG